MIALLLKHPTHVIVIDITDICRSIDNRIFAELVADLAADFADDLRALLVAQPNHLLVLHNAPRINIMKTDKLQPIPAIANNVPTV